MGGGLVALHFFLCFKMDWISPEQQQKQTRFTVRVGLFDYRLEKVCRKVAKNERVIHFTVQPWDSDASARQKVTPIIPQTYRGGRDVEENHKRRPFHPPSPSDYLSVKITHSVLITALSRGVWTL